MNPNDFFVGFVGFKWIRNGSTCDCIPEVLSGRVTLLELVFGGVVLRLVLRIRSEVDDGYGRKLAVDAVQHACLAFLRCPTPSKRTIHFFNFN